MSYLQKQMNTLKFDKRLLEINIKNAHVSEEEYQQHLASLEDMQHNAGVIELSAESDSDSFNESMNGDSHPAESVDAQQAPRNNDPFGSGF